MLERDLKQVLYVLNSDDNFTHFNLDGQLSLLTDFIANNLNYKDLIIKLMSAKKLAVPPSFVQQDYFNSSPESILMNMEIAYSFSKTNNLPIPATMYTPDSFGFPSNLPSFLKTFGFKNWVFWRGISPEQIKKSVINYFVSPNKDSVLSYNFYFGYTGFVSSFFDEVENLTLKGGKEEEQSHFEKVGKDIVEKINEIFESSDGNVKHILAPFGADQFPIIPSLPYFIKKADEIDIKNTWKVSSIEDFFQSLEISKSIPTINGNIREPYKARTHRTISSNRMDIKLLFRETERLLYNVLSPFYTICKTIIDNLQKNGTVQHAIEEMIKCSAHDSLGGCNSDRTNRGITGRLERSKSIFQTELNILMRDLSYFLAPEDDSGFLINLYPTERQQVYVFKLVVDHLNFALKVDDLIVTNFSITKKLGYHDFKFHNVDKHPELNYEFYYVTVALETAIEWMCWRKISFEYQNKVLPCFSLISPKKETGLIENKSISFQVTQDGTEYVDRRHNKTYKNVMMVGADFDKGDSYDYSPSKVFSGSIIVSQKNKNIVVHESQYLKTIKYETEITYFMNEALTETSTQIFKWSVSLAGHSKILRIKVKTQNKSTETRWKLGFKNNKNSKCAKSLLHWIYNDCSPVVNEQKWKDLDYQEYPAPVYQNNGLVFFEDDGSNFVTLNKGVGEFTPTENQINYVLFRTPSFLGKTELLWRPGRPSGTSTFKHETPDGTLQKEMKFEFGISIVENKKNIISRYQIFNEQYVYYQRQKKYFFENSIANFKILRPEDKRVTDFLKKKINKAIDIKISNWRIGMSTFRHLNNNRVLLRLYNPSGIDEQVILSGKSLLSVRLSDGKLEKDEPFNNVVPAKSFITLIIKLKHIY